MHHDPSEKGGQVGLLGWKASSGVKEKCVGGSALLHGWLEVLALPRITRLYHTHLVPKERYVPGKEPWAHSRSSVPRPPHLWNGAHRPCCCTAVCTLCV